MSTSSSENKEITFSQPSSFQVPLEASKSRAASATIPSGAGRVTSPPSIGAFIDVDPKQYREELLLKLQRILRAHNISLKQNFPLLFRNATQFIETNVPFEPQVVRFKSPLDNRDYLLEFRCDSDPILTEATRPSTSPNVAAAAQQIPIPKVQNMPNEPNTMSDGDYVNVVVPPKVPLRAATVSGHHMGKPTLSNSGQQIAQPRTQEILVPRESPTRKEKPRVTSMKESKHSSKKGKKKGEPSLTVIAKEPSLSCKSTPEHQTGAECPSNNPPSAQESPATKGSAVTARPILKSQSQRESSSSNPTAQREQMSKSSLVMSEHPAPPRQISPVISGNSSAAQMNQTQPQAGEIGSNCHGLTQSNGLARSKK